MLTTLRLQYVASMLVILLIASNVSMAQTNETEKFQRLLSIYTQQDPDLSQPRIQAKPEEISIQILARAKDGTPTRVLGKYIFYYGDQKQNRKWKTIELFVADGINYGLLFNGSHMFTYPGTINGDNVSRPSYDEKMKLYPYQDAIWKKLQQEWAEAKPKEKEYFPDEVDAMAKMSKYDPSTLGKTVAELTPLVKAEVISHGGWDNFFFQINTLMVEVLEKTPSGKPAKVRGSYTKKDYSGRLWKDRIEILFDEGLPYLEYFLAGKIHTQIADEYPGRIETKIFTPLLLNRDFPMVYSEQQTERIKNLQKKYLDKEFEFVHKENLARYTKILKEQQQLYKPSFKNCVANTTIAVRVPYSYQDKHIEFENGKNREFSETKTAYRTEDRPAFTNKCTQPVFIFGIKKGSDEKLYDLNTYESVIIEIRKGDVIEAMPVSDKFDYSQTAYGKPYYYLSPFQ